MNNGAGRKEAMVGNYAVKWSFSESNMFNLKLMGGK